MCSAAVYHMSPLILRSTQATVFYVGLTLLALLKLLKTLVLPLVSSHRRQGLVGVVSNVIGIGVIYLYGHEWLSRDLKQWALFSFS